MPIDAPDPRLNPNGIEGRRNRGFAYVSRVGGKAVGKELLDHLCEAFTHSSRSTWQARIDAGEVTLGGRRAEAGEFLRCEDRLVWHRPPWVEPSVPLDFAVLHRDRDLIAVAKPSGLPTLPGGGFLESTLLAVVRERFPEASPLHRLGRGTSGIVLLARNRTAGRKVLSDWEQGVKKVYRALAGGTVGPDSFEVDAPIGKAPHHLLGYVHAAASDGKPSRSLVRVLERRKEATLVEVEIITGRPHQIRIHMATAGHPLLHDPLYPPGGVPDTYTNALPGDPGYLLHAMHLSLRQPSTGRVLNIDCMPPRLLRYPSIIP